MAKKSYILIAVLFTFGLVIIVLATVYVLQKHQAFLEQRHHLLCEVLKPGMSKDEVINVLRQSGDFTINPDSLTDVGYTNLLVDTEDPHTDNQYGSFTLGFTDNKYETAFIRHGSSGEDTEVICDFYSTPSKIETPTPSS
jgi:hypothetical protein